MSAVVSVSSVPVRSAPPRAVLVVTGLLIAGAALELIDGAVGAVRFLTSRGDWSGAAIAEILWALFAATVLVALAVGVRRGSPGCRLAVTVIGVGWFLTSPVHVSTTTSASMVIGTLESLLVVVSLVLMYLPGSLGWFTPVSPAQPAPGAPPVDPALTQARSDGWRTLGVVLGIGLPLSLVWMFVVAWGASDGCSGGSTRPQCATTTLLIEGGAPAVATVVATVLGVVGLVLARWRPRVASVVIHAALVAWFVLGIGLHVLAQHV